MVHIMPHHCGRALPAGAIIQLIMHYKALYVRRTGINLSDPHLYSFSSVIGAAVFLWLFDREDMVRTSALTIALLDDPSRIRLLRFIPESAAMQFSEHVRGFRLGVNYHLALTDQCPLRWAHGTPHGSDRHL